MADKIFVSAGGVDTLPVTLEARVTTALKPGTIVKVNTTDGKFAVAGASDDRAELLVLVNDEGTEQGVETAYTADDTGFAYRIIPGQKLNVRSTAVAWNPGQAVTVADSGQIAAAGANDVIVGFVESDYASAVTAGDLVTIRCANMR